MARTLVEVARLAGVSRSTVSRVINDHPNVGTETRQRVWQAVRESGYQPHAVARSLVTKRTHIIGMVIPELVTALFTDPFFPILLRSATESCNEHRNQLMLSLFSSSADRQEMYERLVGNAYLDGVIVASAALDDPLIPDLAELVRHAEDVGLVAGLLTNGIRLADKAYLGELVAAGLDHVQITLESHDEEIHNRMVGAEAWKATVQGIKNAVATDVYTITNSTLTTLNASQFEKTIDFLKDLGIETFACNSLIYSGKGPSSGIGIPETELESLMVRVRDKAVAKGMRLIWYTPTQYCEFHPVDLELGAKFCTAARYNMCIEPNGDVIPCQSYYSSLGNILRDDWDSIWNHPDAVGLRNRDWVMEKCRSCDELPLCGGGCPLYLQNEGTLCIESTSTAV